MKEGNDRERSRPDECLNAQERDSASRPLSDTERGHLSGGCAQPSEGHVKANRLIPGHTKSPNLDHFIQQQKNITRNGSNRDRSGEGKFQACLGLEFLSFSLGFAQLFACEIRVYQQVSMLSESDFGMLKMFQTYNLLSEVILLN